MFCIPALFVYLQGPSVYVRLGWWVMWEWGGVGERWGCGVGGGACACMYVFI